MNQGPQKDSSRPPLRPNGPASADTLKLVDELKALAADILGKGIERMFDGADDMLFEMARRATNNKDQRIYFDTMRVVRLGRPKIGGVFRDHIRNGFSLDDEPDLKPEASLELEELSLQESRSLEESIAVKSMASKAEGLYAPVLFELGRRIEAMIKDKNAPIAEDALSPAKISDAFRRSAETLDVEFDIELVIFKLFDRLVISELGDLYARVIGFLDEKGIKPAAVSGQRPRAVGVPAGAGAVPAGAAPAAGDAGQEGEGIVGGQYQFASPPVMDAGTLGSLRQMSATPIGGGAMSGPVYGQADAQLGAELATAASGQVVPGWEAPRAYAYVQRAGAVGQMFNDLMQDPTLPAPLKPRFDQLRFSVIKSALRDTSFFADHKHPVRGLMNELTTLAASARASGMEALQRIEELVGQIQGQFDVAAEDVRAQTALPGKVDEKTLEGFFSQQKEEARQRRQAIIERTRRVVAEELQLQLLGRNIPDGMRPLLNSGWAPLAALRLLKQGADSEGWNDAMSLLKSLLESVDPRRPAARGSERLNELEADTRQRLNEVGMIEDRVNALISSWRESLDEVESEEPASPPEPAPLTASDPGEQTTEPESDAASDDTDPAVIAAPGPSDDAPSHAEPEAPEAVDEPDQALAQTPDANTLLDLLMVLSSWFRVYDHDRGQNRWLKVVAHHPADGVVTFAEFNGQNKLQMRTSVFLDDLVGGRAEPIDLGPAARRSLDAYLASRREEAATEQA